MCLHDPRMAGCQKIKENKATHNERYERNESKGITEGGLKHVTLTE